MRILYIPLDERPCNYNYPQYIARLQPQLELLVPPVALLGRKKESANVDRLWQWFVERVPQCDCSIVSLEMLDLNLCACQNTRAMMMVGAVISIIVKLKIKINFAHS